MEEKKIEKLYELLERAERERDTETAALFAGRYSSLKTDRRSKSAFFACNYAPCVLLLVYLYLCFYEHVNALQARPKLARLD